MADSWHDSEVAVRDQPGGGGGSVISWFPPGTLSSALAVRPRGFEKLREALVDQSWGSRFPPSEIHEPRSLLNIHPTHVTNYSRFWNRKARKKKEVTWNIPTKVAS